MFASCLLVPLTQFHEHTACGGGWTKAIMCPPAPGRGSVSISRTPFSARYFSSPFKSATEKQICCTPGPRFARNLPIGVSSPVGSKSSIFGTGADVSGSVVEKKRVRHPGRRPFHPRCLAQVRSTTKRNCCHLDDVQRCQCGPGKSVQSSRVHLKIHLALCRFQTQP